MEKTLLVVIDGFGVREEIQGNAAKQADTPNLDRLKQQYNYAELDASGPAVGLPEGFTGNSEVGHLHLGAGRTIPQRLTRINKAIENNKLREKEALKNAFQRAEEKEVPIHLAGIISDGGIHGHIDHLKALLEISTEYDVEVNIHCFTDGRDVSPKSAENFLDQIKEWTEDYGGDIATVMGRYYSMDRDHNWDRTYKAYQAMAEAEGFEFKDPYEALNETYKEDDYDYFIQPSVSENYSGMENNHEIVFYNFRADRERQIEEELVADVNPDEYEEPVHPNFTSMFRYEHEIDNPVIFEKKIVENTLGEELEERGYSQLRVAESQKRPHVTFFFNGQRELKFEHEERHFVESDKIKAYDQKPEMHADDITNVVLEAMEKGKKDFILLNFANCDLVGHTGDLEATITAAETVDKNIGRLADKLEDTDYNFIITSDHGNCEDMGTEDSPNTSHTTNPIPVISDHEFKFEEKEIWEIRKLVGTN
ncbi:MAG: 2,3-bisphosphoglycerate-independent phosphoglycerate mutase [Candidatus Nanohaloarchaea archaeon]|jgi:2,3-bisphosphoglycerate-independent phosphoglycerate mutase